MQHDGAAAHGQRLFHAVGHHQRGALFFLDDLPRQVEHEGAGLRVQRRRVLVEQQDFRGLQGRHQQADRLSLTAGEQPHLVLQAVFQPQFEPRQVFSVGLLAPLVQCRSQAASPTPGIGQGQVFLDGQELAGAGQRILEHPGHHRCPGGRIQPRHILTINANMSRTDGNLAGQGVEQRRLAGTVAADDGDELALGDLQIDTAKGVGFQRRADAKPHMNLLHANHVAGLRRR